MGSASETSRAKAAARHLCTGAVVGTFFGIAYFVLDPLAGFWGRFEYLGSPLSRILAVYLLFGVSVGLLVGLVAALVSASAKVYWEPDRYVPLYLALFVFLLVFMHAVRNYSMTRFKSIVTSGELVWVLFLLVGVTAAAFGTARALSKRPFFGRLGARTALALVVSCAAAVMAAQLFASHRENSLPRPRKDASSSTGRPNVVFIVLDALRADHVSAYGYPRNTTPTMDRLAREGVLFRNARSHGNRTVISVPSIFTSLYPAFHGVVGRGDLVAPLPDSVTTIAELFQREGYTTLGMMDNVYLKRAFGLSQGFDRVEEFYTERYVLGLYKLLRHLRIIVRPRYATQLHADADEVTDLAVRWLRRAGDRPFFMYVHYMDTHHPYAPPPPYDTMYGSAGNSAAPMDLFRKTTRLLNLSRQRELEEGELQKLKDYYDGALRLADDQIARLVEEAARVSGRRETVVVVTSDHGDEFMEHGLLYHRNLVIEELIHVPLILWSSKRFARGTEVDCLVRHADLLPTLGDLIGAAAPPRAEGTSLVPLLEGGVASIDVESIAEGDYCASLSRLAWKIVRVDSTDSFHLYDVSRTPREKEDLAGTFPDLFEGMKAELSRYMEKARAARKAREATADEETIRELKALGYI